MKHQDIFDTKLDSSPDMIHRMNMKLSSDHWLESNDPDLLDDEPNRWKFDSDLSSELLIGYFNELILNYPEDEDNKENENFINYDKDDSYPELSLKGVLNLSELISGHDRLIYMLSDRNSLIEGLRKIHKLVEKMNFDDELARDIETRIISALDYFDDED